MHMNSVEFSPRCVADGGAKEAIPPPPWKITNELDLFVIDLFCMIKWTLHNFRKPFHLQGHKFNFHANIKIRK